MKWWSKRLGPMTFGHCCESLHFKKNSFFSLSLPPKWNSFRYRSSLEWLERVTFRFSFRFFKHAKSSNRCMKNTKSFSRFVQKCLAINSPRGPCPFHQQILNLLASKDASKAGRNSRYKTISESFMRKTRHLGKRQGVSNLKCLLDNFDQAGCKRTIFSIKQQL